MTQEQRLIWLIKYLLRESGEYSHLEIPADSIGQFKLYRSLVNIRLPKPISEEYLKTEDEFLSDEILRKGVKGLESAQYFGEDIYLYQGDITLFNADAIVNAANSGMLGCFYPCHGCIDNCIHTFAGVRLRLECDEIMKAQGFSEPTGKAKITSAYNLPSKFVIHTVGPIVNSEPDDRHRDLLASCYRECLTLADKNTLESIAFCCISTGEFHFPNREAAEIAVSTVREYKRQTGSNIKVIFNVFKDIDKKIYEDLLSQ